MRARGVGAEYEENDERAEPHAHGKEQWRESVAERWQVAVGVGLHVDGVHRVICELVDASREGIRNGVGAVSELLLEFGASRLRRLDAARQRIGAVFQLRGARDERRGPALGAACAVGELRNPLRVHDKAGVERDVLRIELGDTRIDGRVSARCFAERLVGTGRRRDVRDGLRRGLHGGGIDGRRILAAFRGNDDIGSVFLQRCFELLFRQGRCGVGVATHLCCEGSGFIVERGCVCARPISKRGEPIRHGRRSIRERCALRVQLRGAFGK